MYRHYTDPKYVETIVRNGLLTGSPVAQASVGVEWVLEYYEENPVYLALPHAEFLAAYTQEEWKHRPYFEVDTEGLRLVADLPSLIDFGARHDQGLLYVGRRDVLKPLMQFADQYGWVEIEHLLDPETSLAAAAIEITGTAACIENIGPARLELFYPAATPQSGLFRP